MIIMKLTNLLFKSIWTKQHSHTIYPQERCRLVGVTVVTKSRFNATNNVTFVGACKGGEIGRFSPSGALRLTKSFLVFSIVRSIVST